MTKITKKLSIAVLGAIFAVILAITMFFVAGGGADNPIPFMPQTPRLVLQLIRS